MRRTVLIAGVAAASLARAEAQVALEGEHARFDLPDASWAVMEEVVTDGALRARLSGEANGAFALAEIATATNATPTEALRRARYYEGQPMSPLPGGGQVAATDGQGGGGLAWAAAPTAGDRVLLVVVMLSRGSADEARAVASQVAARTVLAGSVTGGVSLAAGAPPPEAAAPAAPAPNAAPTGGPAYPVAVFNGSYNLYPRDGYLTLFVMSDGTAQRITRPAKGGREFNSVSMTGNRLVLSGPETITYELSQDGGVGRGTRLNVRGYEHLWAVPPATPEAARRWAGSFQRKRHGSGAGGGYVRPGQPRNTVATTGTDTLRFDRGRYEASTSFMMDATLRGARGADERIEDETGARPGADRVFGRGGGASSGTYKVDGYRLVLSPDDGSGPFEKTIHVQQNEDGSQTLYVDGQVWIGDFDAF